MFDWIWANIGTIAISALLLIAVIAVILNQIKNKKSGKSSCGCGCSSCGMSGSCHTMAKDKAEPK